MTPLSADERAELARLCDAATPGPWKQDAIGWEIDAEGDPFDGHRLACCQMRTDARLIVAAVNALPRLLAQVDGLERDKAALQKLFDENPSALYTRARNAEARLAGMTGERDAEREIAQGWERKAGDLEAERDAYKRAKAENDERFSLERDRARERAVAAEAEVERMREGCDAANARAEQAGAERDRLRALEMAPLHVFAEMHAKLRQEVERMRALLTDVLDSPNWHGGDGATERDVLFADIRAALSKEKP